MLLVLDSNIYFWARNEKSYVMFIYFYIPSNGIHKMLSFDNFSFVINIWNERIYVIVVVVVVPPRLNNKIHIFNKNVLDCTDDERMNNIWRPIMIHQINLRLNNPRWIFADVWPQTLYTGKYLELLHYQPKLEF